MRKLQTTKMLQEEQNYDHMPEICLGPRASELLSVLACKRSAMTEEQYACCAGWEVACLVQDREGHVAYDVRAVDDQRVPLFEADDLVACQVCLLKCLHAENTETAEMEVPGMPTAPVKNMPCSRWFCSCTSRGKAEECRQINVRDAM